MQTNMDVASARKADENMNRTVAVLLKMNLSPEKLSEGIRLAVEEANATKRRLHGSTLCTPSSTVCRQDSTVSCSSESNLSGNYSSEGELYEAQTSKSKKGRRKRKPRTKNIDTAAARLAKKICAEFLFSRRVWTALYDGNNRLSDFRLDVVLKQIAPKMTEAERHLLKDERSEVISRIKRVLALGKSYRIKRAKTGNVVPKAPMEHLINVIDLSGEGSSSLSEIEKEVSEAVTADAPGHAAIARRKLFDANKDKTNSTVKSKKDKRQLAKEFKARLDNARKRPTPLATAKTRRTSKNKRSKKNVVTTTDEVVTTSVSKKNQDDVQTTTRRTRSSKRKAARSARSKIASCSEEEAREESNAGSDPDYGENVTGETESSPELTLKVGAKASGMWSGPENKGDWYSGKIISIDNRKKTVHMQFDDGDEDTNLSWKHLILL